jgi:hypothetical protein
MTKYSTLSVLSRESGPNTTITGFALLTADCDRGRWRFALTVDIADTNQVPSHLIERLADCLPMPDVLIGWQIDRLIVDPISRAAQAVPPILRHYVLTRLARLQRRVTVDLAVGENDTSAESLAEAARRHPVAHLICCRSTVEAQWMAGDAPAVANALKAEVFGLWLMFLLNAPRHVSSGAIAATIRWITKNS